MRDGPPRPISTRFTAATSERPSLPRLCEAATAARERALRIRVM